MIKINSNIKINITRLNDNELILELINGKSIIEFRGNIKALINELNQFQLIENESTQRIIKHLENISIE